jgi:protocatechuate 3,4-dioxygenase alpha subunit
MPEGTRLKETPSQTAGPYLHIGLMPASAFPDRTNLKSLGSDPVSVPGTKIRVGGHILDGAGQPVVDAVIEFWQADADGRYTNIWRRTASDDDGAYRLDTVKPGRATGPDGRLMAPHITLWIVARGINVGLHTRLYFEDEAEANASDLVLNLVRDARRRETLLARKSGDGVYAFDVRLQGEGETVFLDI